MKEKMKRQDDDDIYWRLNSALNLRFDLLPFSSGGNTYQRFESLEKRNYFVPAEVPSISRSSRGGEQWSRDWLQNIKDMKKIEGLLRGFTVNHYDVNYRRSSASMSGDNEDTWHVSSHVILAHSSAKNPAGAVDFSSVYC